MECTNNTIENDSNLTITETDLSENVTSLNTVMDLAGIITGRKKCSELTRDEKYRYYKNHFTPTKNNQLYQRKKGKRLILLSNTNGSLTIHGMFIVRS